MKKEQIIQKRQKTLRYLAQLIKSKHITQEQLSERTGFMQTNISRVLLGKYSPTLDVLTTIADAAGYDVAFVTHETHNVHNTDNISPKFLLSVDNVNGELYILHRQYPSCLIWVKQETPTRFIIQDLYDDVSNPSDLLGMPFVEEAKQFYRNYAEQTLDCN